MAFAAIGLQDAAADPGDDPVRKVPPIRISIATLYQEWSREGTSLNEWSIPITAEVRLQPNLGMRLGLSQASARGDGFEQVSGLTDMHVALEYWTQIRSVRVLGNLSVSVPTGTVQLSDEAFRTAFQLGLTQYGFQVPHFGQGLSIAPRIGVVVPAADNLVLSIGLSYRVRGSFEPVSDLVDTYDWGDEFLVNAGGEWQVNETVTVSADALLAYYYADKVGGTTVYEAGSRWVLQAQVHKRMRRDYLGVAVQYRDVGANQALVNGILQPEAVAASSGMIRAAAYYRMQLTRAVRATVRVEGTRYEADAIFDELNVVTLGVAPAVVLSPAVTVPLQVEYALGDLEGLKAGVGVTVIF